MPLFAMLAACTSLSTPVQVADPTASVHDSATDTGLATPTSQDTAHSQDSAASDSPTGDPDDAVIVSTSLPTDLACGDTVWASVTVRNTGHATWTWEDGYKLGAVDDSDDLYGPDVRVWLPEGASVAPGDTWTFDFELTAPQTEAELLTDWRMVHEGVRWFGEETSAVVAVQCTATAWCDPLTSSSLQSGFLDKDVDGGSFSSAGWQTTSDDDQLLLELPTTLGGTWTFSVDVDNFDPHSQYSGSKHQIINMYTSDNGSQDVFSSDEAWWNIRTGTNYGTGLKLLAAPSGGDTREEVRLIESASWDPSDTHTFQVTWNDSAVVLSLDGSELTELPFGGQLHPMQHVFLGRDNVYGGQVGPIYSDLCVTWEP